MLHPLLLALLLRAATGDTLPTITAYVASEAVDIVSRVHFGQAGATVRR